MSMSRLDRHSPKLDIQDHRRMSMSELAQHSSCSILGTSVECRCQSWLDIRPSSIFGTFADCRCQSWIDIRSSSLFGTFSECR
ncbi:hypothetical protein DPMN_164745 [Dreissena polymorpha]|uniref:Uncharacterized protein n=1 Tax=Dreissena polymorpha TaxID=45954 RepID=A0A9D4EVN7_DREPO|nr:hypothetical protein DPMN_164745 [Dreissena polymorpha]